MALFYLKESEVKKMATGLKTRIIYRQHVEDTSKQDYWAGTYKLLMRAKSIPSPFGSANMAYTGRSNAISTAMNEMGIDGSYPHREKVAAANGIVGFTGTYTQNVTMLTLLKQGRLIKE